MDYSFSIIIPNRNIFALLRQCLDSIPQRSDLEVIVVDDNSDPSIVDFADYPGLDRPDTQVVFTKEGRGAGYARNVGLQKASGKWILFSDSDDSFETDNLNRMLDTYMDSEADIIFFNANRVDESTGAVLSQHLSKAKFERNPKQYAGFMRFLSNVPWAKMIRRELIEKNAIKFSEVPAANDMFFSAVSGYYAKDVIIDFTVVYDWKVRKSGSITSTVSKRSVLSKLDQAAKKNVFLWDKGEKSWCSNLYTAFYWRLRGVGMSHGETMCELKKRINAGPELRWRVEMMLSWPLYAIRRRLR